MAEPFTILGIIVAVLLGDAFVCTLVTVVLEKYLDADLYLLPSLVINVSGFIFVVTGNIIERIS